MNYFSYDKRIVNLYLDGGANISTGKKLVLRRLGHTSYNIHLLFADHVFKCAPLLLQCGEILSELPYKELISSNISSIRSFMHIVAKHHNAEQGRTVNKQRNQKSYDENRVILHARFSLVRRIFHKYCVNRQLHENRNANSEIISPHSVQIQKCHLANTHFIVSVTFFVTVL